MISFEDKLRKDCPAIFKITEGLAPAQPGSTSYGDGLMNAFVKAAGGDRQQASRAMLHLINTPELLQKIIAMSGNPMMGGQGEVTRSVKPQAFAGQNQPRPAIGPNPFGNK